MFLSNKWYFDELIDFAIVRPALWFGRVVDTVLERDVIAGGSPTAPSARSAPASAAVRRAQTGFVRYYAALMIVVPRRRRPLLPDLELVAT